MEYALGIGANRGDRAATMARAAELLAADGMVRVTAGSRALATAPVGGPPGQPPYLNAAWIVATALGPHQLLHRLQRIERELGRARTVVDGPRTIDLDLLLRRDGLIVRTPVLSLPHPRLHQRRFVLEPLAEIAGDWRHPLLRATVNELLARLAP